MQTEKQNFELRVGPECIKETYPEPSQTSKMKAVNAPS